MEKSVYLIMLPPASYLKKGAGWGPTFTMFTKDARTFPTEEQAKQYIGEHLEGFGCVVVHSIEVS